MTWLRHGFDDNTVTWRRAEDDFLITFVRVGEPSSGLGEPPVNIEDYAPPVESQAPSALPAITKLAFRMRFTQAEKAAVEFAALDDPAATIETRQLAASLRSQLRDLEVANEIYLDHPDLVAGVQTLELVGILAAGRANEILTAPIAETELA